jgi:uncharacterized protein (DUF2345 family)
MTDESGAPSIVTSGGLRLLFDDDRKEITVVTPGNNRITLSDEAKSISLQDSNGNSVLLSPDGIRLDSPMDIVFNARGRIALSAVGEIALKATQDVKVSGLNVTNTAQVGFTGKGNATAELSASGQTTVKGGIVMIN